MPAFLDQLKSILELVVLLSVAAVAVAVGVGAILKQFQGSKDELGAKADAEATRLIATQELQIKHLEGQVTELRGRVVQLETQYTSELAARDAEINRQKGELAGMRAENDRLRARNGDLEIRVDELGKLNAKLSRRVRASDTVPFVGLDRRTDAHAEDEHPEEETADVHAV